MKIQISQSKVLRKTARKVIPDGTDIMRSPQRFTEDAYPMYVQSAHGSKIVDVDGNEYTDFTAALGTCLLGYSFGPVVKAIQSQAKNGGIFSIGHPLEVEVGQLLKKMIPNADYIRWVKNGSDATTGAIRIARAYTKKNGIGVCGHYHGWHDWSYVQERHNEGIPAELKKNLFHFQFNNPESVRKLIKKNRKKIACLIMEPMIDVQPTPAFLQALKDAQKQGILIIWDEVVMGFRLSQGGAQEYFRFTPDLACYGKTLSNGMALAAITGRKKVMEKTSKVGITMTASGETISLAAAQATLQFLRSKPVNKHLWKIGSRIKKGYNSLATKHSIPTRCDGIAARLILRFEGTPYYSAAELRAYIFQEMAARGFLLGPEIFPMYSHTTSHVSRLLSNLDKVLADISHVKKKLPLEGKPSKDPWED